MLLFLISFTDLSPPQIILTSDILLKKSELLGSLFAYDDYFKSRLNINTYGLYVHYRKDLIKELVSLFPELYSKEVRVYKDSGIYQKYDTFYL